MIEKRRANLQAVRHRHFVDLHQDAIGQHCVELYVLLTQGALVRGVIRPALHRRERVAIHAFEHFRPEYPGSDTWRHEVLPTDVLAVGRQDGALQEALEDVAGPFLDVVVAQSGNQCPVEGLTQRKRNPREDSRRLARTESVIAHQQLIAPVAAEADLYVPTRFLADQHERQV